MDAHQLETLLQEIKNGTTSVSDGLARVSATPIHDLGHSRLDTHRELRCGHPEVVFGQGKSLSELVEISTALLARHGRLIVTRVGDEGARELLAALPRAVHHERARMVTVADPKAPPGEGLVLVASAGTSDGPVAEEAIVTARALGARVEELRDVGVAGVHRLLAHVDLLRRANVIVVVAGMEGALASVVGGLVERPVVAVPTSVGYGASFEGLAALLAMLNSCAAGVSVVNIDNGFGAGYCAAQINRLAKVKA
ncbi:MAG TPA: nickel pincer cofactor biosynthesis protein LarB [Planctomycetota bacterium]|nr:nickel pincer cofactor biosynthesis protein LarB [Planctomycetota bacterium]